MLRNPAAVFAALALPTLLLLAGMALWIAHLPDSSFHVRPAKAGQVLVEGVGLYPETGRAMFVDRQGRDRLGIHMLTMMFEKELRGTPAENRAHYTERETAARLLTESGMRLRLPDSQELPAHSVAGSIETVDPGMWLSLGIGLCSALAGWWVLVLRPREWAARMFAINGLGMMIASITIALSVRRSLALGVNVQFWAIQINYLASHMFGLSMVALFSRYPFPLVPKWVLAVASGLMAGLWILGLFDLWANVFSTHLLFVLMEGTATVLLALVQAWKARRDPALRASFTLIGSSLLFCIFFFSVANLIPQMLGQADLFSVPVSATAFLVFDLALAVAIARYRLFDLGGWALNVATVSLVLVFVLIVDFVLVLLTDASWTISVAFLAAATAWLPIREILLRRSDRKRSRQDIHLLRGANEVAFALRPEQQAAMWQELIRKQFSPLTVEPCRCDTAEIRDDGRILAIPSPLGGTGSALGFAGQGSRLFNNEDKSVASALVTLVREMAEARAAYDRGVQNERQRIARDLHDDVGARLMTTLHRDDLSTVHADVREAMADMRLIIDGMSGQTRRFSDILADLRHETVNRLTLARIHAIWPVNDLFDDERPVGPLQNRVLFSVVRELVSNIIRHSGASEVTVDCDLRQDELLLHISDNGWGFDADSEANMGNGLRNTRKRLEELKGSLSIASDAGGSAIAIQLPVLSPEQGMAGAALAG